ncbi:MAG: uracil-xanthine permease [Bacilli bacterium]|nr:uracil-xanthine permease [Bacilli bacterium]
MKEKKMVYDINETPPLTTWIILALQHVFAMFGATILVPILVNSAAGEEVLTIPVALVASGIGTLIYILCTKGKSPVYLGSSFAFITPIAAAYLKGGISGAMTGIMAVGLIYVIIAIIIKFVGKNWLDKLLPPVVIGPMIMIIGLGLAPSAISQIGLASGTAFDPKTMVVVVVSFLVTALLMTKAKGFFKVIPFLIGIISGYIVAVCLGMIDFKPVAEASFFSVPKFVFPFVNYKLNFAALITIAPIALVTLCEHIGDHTSLGNIIGRDLIKDPGLDRTLLGDGIATFVAGAIGGPANTTYGENTSVVGMTRVASVKVIGLAAVIAILIGFLGKFTALVSTIPNAVLGGVSLLLYGFIAVNGLKVLIKNQVNFEDSKNVIVASSMLVLGLGGAVIAINSGDLSLTISGMSLASVVGILLNLFLPADSATLKEVKVVTEKEEVVETKIKRTDINKLKKEIKDELTVELKEDILKEIREKAKEKTTKSKK